MKVVIPRPIKDENVVGLGKAFIQFESVEAAKKARADLTKKTFDDLAVEGHYLDEEAFLKGNYDM